MKKIKQKCVITIMEGSEPDSISINSKWTPDLDMKNDDKNNRAVVAASFAALKAIQKMGNPDD